MRRILIPILILFPLFNFAQIEEVRRITETLCAENFHGRGYVNKGDSLAADFLVEEFKKIDAQPLGQDFLQHFNIETVNVFPGEMTVSLNGINLSPGKHFLVDPSSGGINSEFNLHIVEIETCLNPELLGQKLASLTSNEHNAIVLDLVDIAPDTMKLIAGLPQALAEYLPVFELTNKKFTWSVGREQYKFPLIQIQDSIFDAATVARLNIDAELIRNYTSQNVIAFIPSKKKCKKTVVFTAHYDHLGRMGEQTYFPGANDNASGTAMLLTMAKHFKKHPPKFNLLFIAFAGEEAGLLGSKHFVENPALPLKEIKFLVNLDIMGSGEEGITAVNATLFEKEFKKLSSINEKNDLLATVKRRGPAANSDHYWFTEAGVPSFFIYTMGPNKNYHDVFDTYDNLSFSEYDDITALLIEFVSQL